MKSLHEQKETFSADDGSQRSLSKTRVTSGQATKVRDNRRNDKLVEYSMTKVLSLNKTISLQNKISHV